MSYWCFKKIWSTTFVRPVENSSSYSQIFDLREVSWETHRNDFLHRSFRFHGLPFSDSVRIGSVPVDPQNTSEAIKSQEMGKKLPQKTNEWLICSYIKCIQLVNVSLLQRKLVTKLLKINGWKIIYVPFKKWSLFNTWVTYFVRFSGCYFPHITLLVSVCNIERYPIRIPKHRAPNYQFTLYSQSSARGPFLLNSIIYH